MDASPAVLAALLLGGIFAGIANVMAGGGSLVTLPLLVLLGLPPTVANGTNRVAILVQNVVATGTFHHGGHLPWRLWGKLVVPTLAGAAAGAFTASQVPDDTFRPILAVMLIALAAFVLLDPRRWLSTGREIERLPWWAWPAFVLLGFHGGFIQAGLGFFVLAALVPGLGLDLVRANGVKVALVMALTVLSLSIFAAAGQVAWVPGLVLAAGSGAGGYLGSRLTVAKGARWVRWVLVVMVVASALHILGVLPQISEGPS